MDAQMQKSRTVYARGLNNFCGGQRGRYLWGALPANGRDCMSLPWSVVETERGTGTTVGVQTNASACVVELSCNPPKSSATNSWAHTHTHIYACVHPHGPSQLYGNNFRTGAPVAHSPRRSLFRFSKCCRWAHSDADRP